MELVIIYTIICKCCGEEYASRYSTTKFCSDKCRRKYNGKTKGHKQICKQCNKVFHKYKIQDCCSRECHYNFLNENKKRKETHIKECPICNKIHVTTKANKLYCSQECSYQNQLNKLNEKRKLNLVHYQKRCKECGRHFSSTRTNACFCSTECSSRYENRRKETARRRRIRKNGKVDWNISIERLVKRDNAICYLCGSKVIMSVDTNHDDYPSIEHVIPVARGGTHTWDNVKLAHRKCNYEKGDLLLDGG